MNHGSTVMDSFQDFAKPPEGPICGSYDLIKEVIKY